MMAYWKIGIEWMRAAKEHDMFFKRKKPSDDDDSKLPKGVLSGETGPLNDPDEAKKLKDALEESGSESHPTLRLQSQQFASLLDLTPAPDWSKSGGDFQPVPKNAPPPPEG